MRNWTHMGVLALALGFMLSPCLLGQGTSHSGSKNLTGLWTRVGRVPYMAPTAAWTAAGKAAFEANKPSFGPRAIDPALGNDPMGTCDPLGMPRQAFVEVADRSMEFLQSSDRVVQFFEWQHQFRTIWTGTDDSALPKNPDPRWNGYSIGRWDGDTFVVDSNGFDDRTWLDMYGDPHSDALQVEERYRRVDPNTLSLVITFTDSKYLMKPWTSPTIQFKSIKGKGVDDTTRLETFCVPTEEEAFNKRIRDLTVKKSELGKQ